MNLIPKLLACVLFTATPFLCFAETGAIDSTGKYVSIHVEVKELKESGLVLKEATANLSTALNKISEDLDQLSPEQLVLINELADKVDLIVDKLNSSFTSLPDTLDRAKQPTTELLNNALKTTREQTIDPVVAKLESWMIVTIVGLVLLGLILLIAMYVGFRSVATLGDKLKDIADGYRIIPIEQYTQHDK